MEYQHPQLKLAYDKTLLVIKGCQTIEQLEGAINMVKNFKTLYRKVGYPKVLSYSLDNAIQKQHTICQL
jgi:3-deoxy-D-manno-octulosonic acid (KDO) 8-phosphate synthase